MRTFFHHETAPVVRHILELCRKNGTRIRLVYGDTKTGRSWGEENHMFGTVGRSTGKVKIPLLVHNSRSMGGGGILTHCIIGIRLSRKDRDGKYQWMYRNRHYMGQE